MFTFLKGEYKKKIVGEYRKRLLIICFNLSVLLSIILLGLSLLFFISLQGEDKAVILEKEAYSQKMTDSGQAEVENQIKNIQGMITVIKQNIGNAPLTSVIEKVILEKNSDIKISDLSLERKKDGWLITLGGKAATREAMVLFSNKLEAVPSFSGVDLPVSSLAKNKDISFTISLISKF